MRGLYRITKRLPLLGIAWLTVLLGASGCVSDRFPDATGAVPTGVSTAAAALGQTTLLGSDVEAFYRHEGPETLTVVVVPRGAGATPDRVTVLQVMWRPKASATPLDATATNTAVRHLVFAAAKNQNPLSQANTQAKAGDENRRMMLKDHGESNEVLGVFAGGGFVRLGGDPAAGVLDLSLREADLRLTDASADYDHPLRRTRLMGRVTAHRDDAAVTRMLHDARLRAAEALGYPGLVRGDKPACVAFQTVSF